MAQSYDYFWALICRLRGDLCWVAEPEVIRLDILYLFLQTLSGGIWGGRKGYLSICPNNNKISAPCKKPQHSESDWKQKRVREQRSPTLMTHGVKKRGSPWGHEDTSPLYRLLGTSQPSEGRLGQPVPRESQLQKDTPSPVKAFKHQLLREGTQAHLSFFPQGNELQRLKVHYPYS